MRAPTAAATPARRLPSEDPRRPPAWPIPRLPPRHLPLPALLPLGENWDAGSVDMCLLGKQRAIAWMLNMMFWMFEEDVYGVQVKIVAA